MMPPLMSPSDLACHWGLDPTVAMLNHGSFGACPRAVLAQEDQFRQQMEAEPVRFFIREMPPLLDASRAALAGLIGARTEDLVFVHNATVGVNSVLRSLRFQPGDELLMTDHGYNACNNVVRYVAERAGAQAVVAEVPVPVESPEQVVDAILARVTERTRLALLDHVTSPTAIVFPIAELVARLDRLGIDTLVDGAHAPGMLPLDLEQIGAAYYTANVHKWLCAPKGAGFLHVRADRQEGIQPAILGHGYNQARPGYTRFQDAFDWPGTDDLSAWLCVAAAIRFLEGLLPGGLPALMERNRQLVLAMRRMLIERLGARPIACEAMTGSMSAFYLSDDAEPAAVPGHGLPLQRMLLDRFGIEVPVFHWPAAPRRILRISAQAYNAPPQYERLAAAVAECCSQGSPSPVGPNPL